MQIKYKLNGSGINTDYPKLQAGRKEEGKFKDGVDFSYEYFQSITHLVVLCRSIKPKLETISALVL